ncbi:MAG TPA: hypothetical protein VFC72_00140 [Corynebacterium sp.]|nr:hypothetical protein [Corynebacterium sp.]
MKDPTRIPAVLAALQRAWEGQPDLDLAALWGIVENHGVGWGSGDTELTAVLEELARRHPASLTDPGEALIIADTLDPLRRITVDPVLNRVTVRGAGLRPATWRYREIRRLAVALPAVITDLSGVDHRLGVIRRLSVRDYPAELDVSGVLRTRMGEKVIGAELSDGSLLLISHGIDLFTPGRRDIGHTRHRYEKLLEVRAGAPVRFLPVSGSQPVTLPEVERLFPVEC